MKILMNHKKVFSFQHLVAAKEGYCSKVPYEERELAFLAMQSSLRLLNLPEKPKRRLHNQIIFYLCQKSQLSRLSLDHAVGVL